MLSGIIRVLNLYNPNYLNRYNICDVRENSDVWFNRCLPPCIVDKSFYLTGKLPKHLHEQIDTNSKSLLHEHISPNSLVSLIIARINSGNMQVLMSHDWSLYLVILLEWYNAISITRVFHRIYVALPWLVMPHMLRCNLPNTYLLVCSPCNPIRLNTHYARFLSLYSSCFTLSSPHFPLGNQRWWHSWLLGHDSTPPVCQPGSES